MSACIEEHDIVFSTEGTEWHDMAKHTTKEKISQDIEENLLVPILSGVPSLLMESGEVIKLEAYQTILADIRFRQGETSYVPLHTPKKSYRPISNKEVYDCVRGAIEGTGATITTAGTLENLKKFFISVDLGGDELRAPNGDKFAAFLSFMTAHDGTLTLTCLDSFIRIVCMNTFRASLFSGGNALNVSIPHTKNAGVQINNFSDYLNQVLVSRGKVMEAMGFLLNYVVSDSEVDSVLAGFFTEEESEEMSTRSFNRIEPIKTLFRKGKGNHGESRYDLFNGFTEYFTSGEGAGGSKADKAKRLTVSQFGKAADHKENFLTLLLDDNRYQETRARGEKLFRDKQLAMS